MRRLRAWLCRLLGCTHEEIVINAPIASVTISSPVTVSGVGRASQHNQLFVEVRDASNTVIGSGPASITAPLGQRGPFSSSITFSPPTSGSPGHVQVYDSSPATGAVTHLASVLVRF
jgi:hypothetical protein